jgi:hypothetical protein
VANAASTVRHRSTSAWRTSPESAAAVAGLAASASRLTSPSRRSRGEECESGINQRRPSAPPFQASSTEVKASMSARVRRASPRPIATWPPARRGSGGGAWGARPAGASRARPRPGCVASLTGRCSHVVLTESVLGHKRTYAATLVLTVPLSVPGRAQAHVRVRTGLALEGAAEAEGERAVGDPGPGAARGAGREGLDAAGAPAGEGSGPGRGEGVEPPRHLAEEAGGRGSPGASRRGGGAMGFTDPAPRRSPSRGASPQWRQWRQWRQVP